MDSERPPDNDLENARYWRRHAGAARAVLMAHVVATGNLSGCDTEKIERIVNEVSAVVPIILDDDLDERIHSLLLTKPDGLDAWNWVYLPRAFAAMLSFSEASDTLPTLEQLIDIIKRAGEVLGALPQDGVLRARCEHFLEGMHRKRQ